MTIIDVNLLFYAYQEDFPQHAPAAAWLKQLFAGPETVGLAWTTLWAFVRLSTSPRVLPKPMTGAAAFDQIRNWLSQPGVVIIHPGPHHMELLERLVTESNAAGPLVSDAVLAALALEHNATLASTDRDFSRFGNLRWINPIQS